MAGLKAMYFWWVQQSCLIFSTATAARINERVIWLYSLKMHPLFFNCLNNLSEGRSNSEFCSSFSWSHLTLSLGMQPLISSGAAPMLRMNTQHNRRITRWNNILSKLKTSPKRYGHLKMPTLSVQTKHWHLLYECFHEKKLKMSVKNPTFEKAYLCLTKSGHRLLMCTLHSLAVTLDGRHNFTDPLYNVNEHWAKIVSIFPKLIFHIFSIFLKLVCNNSFGPKLMCSLALLLFK